MKCGKLQALFVQSCTGVLQTSAISSHPYLLGFHGHAQDRLETASRSTHDQLISLSPERGLIK